MLGDRMAVNVEKRLLEGVDPEPLLKGYRQRPGQQTWIGEHIGKFIDAATNAWAYSGDARLKAKLDRAVSDLLATQLDDGYLGTYLEPDRFKDYGDAEFEPSESLPLWDVWAHKYNLLALLNYYQRTGFEPALAAARRIGDLLCRKYGEGRQSIARNDWHVGMANTSVLEPMATLYRLTGDARYLEFCRYIVRAWDEPKGPKILTTLLTKGRVNEVANGKAYEMTSNFVGLLELYRATGEASYLQRRAARVGRHREEPPLPDRHGKLGRALSRRPPAARRRQGRRGLRDDDLDAGQPEAAGADRRGEVRRRARAHDLQRADRARSTPSRGASATSCRSTA